MLDNDLTGFNLPVVKSIDQMLQYYTENKAEIDQELEKSLDFKYKVIDSFDDAGNKVPSILSHNAIFIDCHYLNKDIYKMIFDVAIALKNHQYGLFIVARPRLNEILVYTRDSLNVCNVVPEVDIVMKNQM